MNSSPMAESDYECLITPTVVANFNLPNSNIDKNGTHLDICEQPQTKFRFRYQSEMVGTHGQLKAESSNKSNNIYPTVKVKNWTGGSVLIKLMLFTAEDNVNDRKKHVHQLHGKNCNNGVCEFVVDDKNDYTAQFPNLGIIHIAKRDVSTIICSRKKEELANHARLTNPGLRNESIQHNISPTDLKQIKAAAEEEAKSMDLNRVVLRFQAFFYDQKRSCYRAITDFVDSAVIFNLKNASTGELKIVRISAVSSSCVGGTEVWMLVEKVKKSNVKIKFFELDHEGTEIWKSYGEFKDSDVHHQYAIVFKTPAYQNIYLREPVHLKVQLERTTDHDTSEPHDFTFTPETLKRSNMFMDQHHHDPEMLNSQKRPRTHSTGPVNLKMHKNPFRGPGEIKNYETPDQSPPQRVPSPIDPTDSPTSQGGFYSYANSYNPSINVCHSDDEKSYNVNQFLSQTQDSQISSPEYNESQYIQTRDPQTNGIYTNLDQLSPSYYPKGGSLYPNSPNLNPPCTSPWNQQVPSPSYGQQSPIYSTGIPSPSLSIASTYGQTPEQTTETSMDQIQQFECVVKQFNSQKQEPLSMPSIIDQAGSPLSQIGFYSPSHSYNALNTISSAKEEHDTQFNAQTDNHEDLLSILENENFFVARDIIGDIQLDCASVAKPKLKNKLAKKPLKIETIDAISNQLSTVCLSDKTKLKEKCDSSFNVTMKAVQQLSSYFSSPKENVQTLLETHKLLLFIQNADGNNAVHSAVLDNNKDMFIGIIRAALNLNCHSLFNVQNYHGETPIHLALKMKQLNMTNQLIKISGVNLELSDYEGNSVLHLASALSFNYLKVILPDPVNGLNQTIKKSINTYNYEGETPLHIAVRRGILENVSLLLKSGAKVHECERKQGANPLHLAVINGYHDIAKYLIENTNITVDAGLLNCDTALHMAVQSKDTRMCSILIAAKANPLVKNRVRKTSKNTEDDCDESSDDEEINEEDFCTPIDYAEGDQKLLEILRQ